MHGDFSLNPLFSRQAVSRVLMQQGRVQLDSDANEQTEVVLRAVRTAVRDIIGPHGGVGTAFEIKVEQGTPHRFRIGYGHYYVDGILAANERPAGLGVRAGGGQGLSPDGLLFSEQPNFPGIDPNAAHFDATKDHLIYLDVWERHISASEDDSLREVALLGPDTTSRAVIVWQVRFLEWTADRAETFKGRDPYDALHELLDSRILLRAKAVKNTDTDPCIISPDSRYRGDNRLYRVEIHDVEPKVTFKWSTDNGSIAYPVRNIEGTTIELDSLGRDDRTAISIGDWVEVVDDESTLLGRPYDLVQVIAVDRSRLEITVDSLPKNPVETGSPRRTILRRWATKPIEVRTAADAIASWFDLADGVSVQFSAPEKGPRYRTGDYWLIPARAATGDVIWPKEGQLPAQVPPHGIDHHYAPLAFWGGNATAGKVFTGARKTYQFLAQ
jgi:Family of unknown function (DUF6519)